MNMTINVIFCAYTYEYVDVQVLTKNVKGTYDDLDIDEYIHLQTQKQLKKKSRIVGSPFDYRRLHVVKMNE